MQSNGGKKNKRKAKKKKNPASSLAPNATGLIKHVHLGDCAANYARCLVDPVSGPLACIPNLPVQFSKKFRVWTKGVMSTGTAGFGFVACDPYRAFGNDISSVFFSANTFASNVIDLNVLSVGVNVNTSNSEYASTVLGADQVFRPVSQELRLRYTGSELNRGGQQVAFHDPDHSSVDARGFTSLDAEETSVRYQIDRSWTSVLYRPLTAGDVDFRAALPTFTQPPVAGESEVFPTCICVQAASAATPLTYEFEVFTVYETYGMNVRAMTPSLADATGFQAVHAVSNLGLNLRPTKSPGHERQKKIVQDVAHYVAHESTFVQHLPTAQAKGSTTNAIRGAGQAASTLGSSMASGVSAFADILDFFF